jgi:hypothetical protein
VKPTLTQLIAAARRMYGTSCSSIYCGGIDGSDRDIALLGSLDPTRDDASEGTWGTARVWIPDAEIDTEKSS